MGPLPWSIVSLGMVAWVEGCVAWVVGVVVAWVVGAVVGAVVGRVVSIGLFPPRQAVNSNAVRTVTQTIAILFFIFIPPKKSGFESIISEAAIFIPKFLLSAVVKYVGI